MTYIRNIFILAMLALCVPAFAIEPSDNPQSLNRYYALADTAYTYLNNGKWTEGEQYLLMALRERPADINNSLLLNNLGKARDNMGRYADALEAYDLALTMTPNSFVILKNRAYTHLALRDYNAACRDIDNALRIEPDDIECLNLHGYICQSTDRDDEAIKDYMQVLKLYPDQEDALIGMVTSLQGTGQLTESEAYTQKLVEKHPSEYAWYLRAYTLIMLDKLAEADEAVHSGLLVDPSSGDLFMLKAYLSKKRYLNEQAKEEKKLAIEYGADPQMVQQFLGW